ncbi:hypothetical protein NPL1_01025 [Metamycoplasma hyosynoviae]|nr:hypothetical protein NPL1_01025 [Metamycoplasma hyosynoviae]
MFYGSIFCKISCIKIISSTNFIFKKYIRFTKKSKCNIYAKHIYLPQNFLFFFKSVYNIAHEKGT